MSFPTFLADVRLACGFLSPDAWETGKVTDPEDRRRAAELADVWLTPAVVADFSPADSAYLVSQAAAVEGAVDAFRTKVAGITDPLTASPHQIDEALAALLDLLGAVRLDLGDAEFSTVRRVVWDGWRPSQDSIPMFDLELGEDWTGDPAVRIWLILNDDQDVADSGVRQRLTAVRAAIRAALGHAGVERWPYISVRSRSEVKELLTGTGA